MPHLFVTRVGSRNLTKIYLYWIGLSVLSLIDLALTTGGNLNETNFIYTG